MFLERVSNEELAEFIGKETYFSKLTFERGEVNGIVYASVHIDEDTELFFRDFDILIMDCEYDEDEEYMKNQWKKFMHEKFGEEYKKAYNENLMKKYEEEMIK